MLDHVGLPAAIRWQVDRIAQRAGFKTEVVTDCYFTRFYGEVEIACYRIVQEALTNVARHARAKTVYIDLQSDGEHLDLSIRDDGIGFNPDMVRRHSKSFGIVSMEERASLLGGQLSIDSSDSGTVIRVRIPFSNQ